MYSLCKMNQLSNQQISTYRQKLRVLLESLEKKVSKAFYSDALFQGTPIEVFRKCGNQNCKCAQGGDQRHGPYKVIQTKIDGRQKQVSLKGSEEKYFKMAQYYQWQISNYREVKMVLSQIDELMASAIDARIIREKQND